MIKAEFETRHFSFEAYGATQAEALSALEAGLSKHATQYHLSPDWYEDDRDDIVFESFTAGVCLRDGETLSCLAHDVDEAPAP